jgi:hypothetical protein
MGDGELLRLHAHGIHGDAAGLHGHRLVILVRRQHPPFQHARQFCLLASREFDILGFRLAGGDQIICRDRCHQSSTPRHEAQHPLALDRIEAEIPRQRCNRGLRAFQGGDHEPRHGIGVAREIARHFPSIETLKTRNSDGLDFHDVAVWSIRDALAAAYAAGQAAAC